MADAKNILKNAFIDAQLIGYSVKPYNFSDEFELKMRSIIKSQKGFNRLINTTAKRVACIILAIFLSLSTVACSIKDVREPIINEIHKFFVNAKELLTNTAADEVAVLFPQDVTKIVGTSYISKSQKQYVIEDEKKVTDFIKLLSETYWGEPEHFEEFGELNTYWKFDFFDGTQDCVLQILMCNDSHFEGSKIAIIKNGEENHFYISNKTYREILAFTNKKFYLHDSKLSRPDKDFLQKYISKATHNLSKENKKEIKKKIRSIHYETEIFLLNNVSLLKEKDSIYWEYVSNGESFTDPITGNENVFSVNKNVITEFSKIIEIIEDTDTKKNLKTALSLWKKSVKSNDLEGLFKVHEYIHDYDYYIFNYPTQYVYDERADYQGLDDYFGRIEIEE